MKKADLPLLALQIRKGAMEKTFGKSLGDENCPQLTEKSLDLQACNCKEVNSTKNLNV